MLKRLYLSPLGRLLAIPLKVVSLLRTPFMVPGYRSPVSGTFLKFVRISSSAILECRKNITVGDNVWIGHYVIIDGSNYVTICNGTQISYGAGIFSHGSHNAIRLYGKQYIHTNTDERKGYGRGNVHIGAYCFIGAHAIILPGVTLGRGCLVAAGSVVTKDAPAFSILRGSPARIVGDVRELDAKFMDDPELRASYFDRDAMAEWIETAKVRTDG